MMNPMLRNLFKGKFYSFMNILGLGIALVCAIFIFLYVSDELSYDNFHNNPERIYRVVRDVRDPEGNATPTATTPPALAGLLQRELPEVDFVTKIFPTNGRKTIFRVGEKSFYESGMYDTDSSIFRVFNFPFKKGSAQTALRSPDDLILTESTAKKYFGEIDPVGQRITVEDQYLGTKELTITAVLRDVPSNSHFRFDILRPASFMIAPQDLDGSWGFAAFHTYVKIKAGTNFVSLTKKIHEIVHRNNADDKSRYSLQPLKDIHLHSKLRSEIGPNGDIKDIIVLITLVALVVLVAAINYVNFCLAQSISRAKEVGVRKITGALRPSLIKKFLGESVLTAFIALFVALVIMLPLLQVFNQFTGKHFTYTLNGNLFLWVCILGFTLVVGIVSGIYPALYLSSLSPIRVLRNSLTKIKSFWGMRNMLMAFQFMTSITLIICTWVIINQIKYVRTAPLGFEPQQVIVIPDVNRAVNLSMFRQKLMQYQQIVSVGASSGMISNNNWHGKMLTRYGPTEIPVSICNIDTVFLRALGIRVLQWQGVSRTDSVGGIVINETAVKHLGFSSPLGEEIFWPKDHRPLKVIGVVEDFHFETFHERITPFAFQFLDQFLSNFFVRVQSSDIPETLEKIKAVWRDVAPNQPFQYFFMDQYVGAQYQAEMKFKTLISVAAVIAILIAFIGLLGLTALLVKNRTKEIGIRKILGASSLGIINLLTKNLLGLILVSNVLACVVAYFAMRNWLSNFAYHISLGSTMWPFILPSIGVLVAAFVTLSLLVLKSTSATPAQVVRNE